MACEACALDTSRSGHTLKGMRRTDPRWIRSRVRLRAAALRIAARGPIDTVSMGTIAAEAEVSRSTAYLHAGSARELLEDALRSELDAFRERRLRRIPPRGLAAARDAAARDVIAHVERHADVYRAGLSGGAGLSALLRGHFADTMQMILREHDLDTDLDVELAPDTSADLVRDLVARSIADSTAGQIEVWVAQPAPRDIEVFLDVNRRMMPAWWPVAPA
jgi:AcrR family transcriptional regulator